MGGGIGGGEVVSFQTTFYAPAVSSVLECWHIVLFNLTLDIIEVTSHTLLAKQMLIGQP